MSTSRGFSSSILASSNSISNLNNKQHIACARCDNPDSGSRFSESRCAKICRRAPELYLDCKSSSFLQFSSSYFCAPKVNTFATSFIAFGGSKCIFGFSPSYLTPSIYYRPVTYPNSPTSHRIVFTYSRAISSS